MRLEGNVDVVMTVNNVARTLISSRLAISFTNLNAHVLAKGPYHLPKAQSCSAAYDASIVLIG